MSARGWKHWWSSLPAAGLISGLMIGTTIALAVMAPPIKNTMREGPSAPEFAYARWTDCDAAGGELATQAMRVPRGVVLRTVDAHGAAMALVPIRDAGEAERLLAGLGCQLPGLVRPASSSGGEP